MTFYWPWKGDDNSQASFEKVLSNLSAKISKKTGQLDNLRRRSRRLSVLWTLYASFAYLLYTIILVLVVGQTSWGLLEYAAVAGGLVIIYVVRLGLKIYYDYRISTIQAQVEDLQKQRDVTIEKLKAATKYNSTQELLKKYGGTSTPKVKPAEPANGKVIPKPKKVPESPRTSFIPPLTANIPGRNGLPSQHTSQNSTPQRGPPSGQQAIMSPSQSPRSPQTPLSPFETSAEFAPNAFPAPLQYAQASESSRWYDRIMDVLLGEDETRSGARLALICSQCRLVNGQAPPGMKRLEDLGKWRCGGCGTMNGEASEVHEIVSGIKKASENAPSKKEENMTEDISKSHAEDDNENITPQGESSDSDVNQYSTEESEEEAGKEMAEIKEEKITPITEPDTPKRRSTRSTKGKKAG